MIWGESSWNPQRLSFESIIINRIVAIFYLSSSPNHRTSARFLALSSVGRCLPFWVSCEIRAQISHSFLPESSLSRFDQPKDDADFRHLVACLERSGGHLQPKSTLDKAKIFLSAPPLIGWCFQPTACVACLHFYATEIGLDQDTDLSLVDFSLHRLIPSADGTRHV